MQNIFEGYYIFSDVDGTLIDHDFNLPQKNLEAVKRFTQLGGKFALATGRSLYTSTLELVGSLPINSPCLMMNGALLYDFQEEKIIYQEGLPDAVEELTDKIKEKYPHNSISLWRPSGRVELGVTQEWMVSAPVGTLKDTPKPWCKIVLYVTSDQHEELLNFARSCNIPGVDVTASSANYVEIMPAGINKGNGVLRFIERFGIDRSKIFTIGDYYNDYEMLSIDGVQSFCTDNAVEEVKKVCTKTLCNVKEGALSELVTYIENYILGK